MADPKTGKSKKNKNMHYSVGAIIKNNSKYLLIERKKPPYGFAGVAGHIDQGESEIEALIREVREESGLKVDKYSLILEEKLDWNWCRRGVSIHHWYLFECKTKGRIKKNYAETESIGWYSKAEIKKLKLEPAWEYWLKKLKII